MDKIIVRDLRVTAIIGVNPVERINKQNIIINLTMLYNLEKCGKSDDIQHTGNARLYYYYYVHSI